MSKINQAEINYINGETIQPMKIDLNVTEPNTLKILSGKKESELNLFASQALSIGVTALETATRQADEIRLREIGKEHIAIMEKALDNYQLNLNDSIKSSFNEYFNADSGKFNTRLRELIEGDGGGELGRLISTKIEGPNSPMHNTLNEFLGDRSEFFKSLDPERAESVVSKIRDSLSSVMGKTEQTILNEFSLDQKDSALSKLVQNMQDMQVNLNHDLDKNLKYIERIFSLDNEDGAISIINNVIKSVSKETRDSQENFQSKVLEKLASLEAKKSISSQTTLHGLEFEESAIQYIEEYFPIDFRPERTGNIPGKIKNCKKGDFVITISEGFPGSGRKIVGETKSVANYTLHNAKKEIEIAKENRGADVGIFVFDKKTAPAGIKPLERIGKNIFVVCDADNNDFSSFLVAAVHLAIALISQKSVDNGNRSHDLDDLENSIDIIEKQIDEIVTINDLITTAENALSKIRSKSSTMKKRIEMEILKFKDIQICLANSIQEI